MKSRALPNARFFVYWNGQVIKLSMKPEQVLRMYWSEPHDEGWSSEYAKYEYCVEDNTISCFTESDGSDCDGRVGRSMLFSCPVSKLKTIWNKYSGVWYPNWTELRLSVRDHQAEAAGY